MSKQEIHPAGECPARDLVVEKGVQLETDATRIAVWNGKWPDGEIGIIVQLTSLTKPGHQDTFSLGTASAANLATLLDFALEP